MRLVLYFDVNSSRSSGVSVQESAHLRSYGWWNIKSREHVPVWKEEGKFMIVRLTNQESVCVPGKPTAVKLKLLDTFHVSEINLFYHF